MATVAKQNVDALAIPAQFDRTEKAKGNGVDLEAIMARLSQLEAENERLRQSKAKAITLKVSEKGALSVYGLGRFPISLYRSQWERLLGAKDDILAFVEENKAKLATKD